MDRRAFITGMTGGLLAAPFVAEVQQAGKVPRLGMLLTGSPSDMRQSRELDALTKKLSELGWVEGRTLVSRLGGRRTPTACPASRPNWSDWASTSS